MNKNREALIKIANDINRKRKNELLHFFSSNSDIQQYIQQLKYKGTFNKNSKSGVWRKIATMPIEVDKFFTDMYGKDYFKDKEFFTKRHPEWAVFDPFKR
jgi:hypothetical protein